MQIRSGLTAEFQMQLDEIVLSEVKTQLAMLPDKARTALGEKELLKMQLRENDKETWLIA